MEIIGVDRLTDLARSRIEQLLSYYADRYGVWQIDSLSFGIPERPKSRGGNLRVIWVAPTGDTDASLAKSVRI